VTPEVPHPPVLDAGLPVLAFFTTRHGGLSSGIYESLNLSPRVGDDAEAVASNRTRVSGFAGATVVYVSQVHGNRVIEANPGREPEADALFTQEDGLAVAVLVADCVPILLHDGASGAVSAVHAGRRGVAVGVVPNAVEALVGLRGSRSGVLSASIGPAICGGCYEVPAEMRDEVAAVAPAAYAETTWGTPSLDLRAAVRAQLTAAGVGNIAIVGPCTRESPDHFSHRRDGVTGRFAGVIRCGGSRT
jgi:polyphenol oxidase